MRGECPTATEDGSFSSVPTLALEIKPPKVNAQRNKLRRQVQGISLFVMQRGRWTTSVQTLQNRKFFYIGRKAGVRGRVFEPGNPCDCPLKPTRQDYDNNLIRYLVYYTLEFCSQFCSDFATISRQNPKLPFHNEARQRNL